MRLYLGTHIIGWLSEFSVPLFVSHRTLREKKGALPRANAPWALDSCGFTELSKFGEWTIPESEYIDGVRRYMGEIGNLSAASIRDHMCEPIVLAKTKKTIPEHQHLTCQSYLSLMDKLPEAPWMPVLQGWQIEDYLRHIELYKSYGIDLKKCKTVGVGSVCRRQGTSEGIGIIKGVYEAGIHNIHAFGFKTEGLKECQYYIQSSDSLAWSFGARYRHPENMCISHKNCANCATYAMNWREELLERLTLQSDITEEYEQGTGTVHRWTPWNYCYFKYQEKRPLVEKREEAKIVLEYTFSCKHKICWMFGGEDQNPITKAWSEPTEVRFVCPSCEAKRKRGKYGEERLSETERQTS